jgi:hypothetical protein
MKVDEAERILGCYLGGNPPAGLDDIAASYRARLRETHPDTGDGTVLPAQLQQAAKTLRQVVTVANNRCKTCAGRGVVRAKMGTTACVACKGTGDKRGS